MNYSRHHPSPRYLELIKLYQEMHNFGEELLQIPADITYAGYSTLQSAQEIKDLLIKVPCLTLLDYGSGKGFQYEMAIPSPNEPDSLHTLKEFWQLQSITCYDPAYPPHADLPEGTFDAVICIDVLEHVPIEDLSWIVNEIFSKASRCVFLAVACYPARKTLSDGSNAHTIIEEPQWWKTYIRTIADCYPDICWCLKCNKSKESNA